MARAKPEDAAVSAAATYIFPQHAVRGQIPLPQPLRKLRPSDQQGDPSRNDMGIEHRAVLPEAEQIARLGGRKAKSWLQYKVHDGVQANSGAQEND
jgi:hypothetical protein